MSQIGRQGRRHACAFMMRTIAFGSPNDDPVDAVPVGVEFVIAEFEGHVQVDHQAGEDPKGETQDVDARGQLMPAETAQGEKQLFLYHNAVEYDVGAAKMGPFLN